MCTSIYVSGKVTIYLCIRLVIALLFDELSRFYFFSSRLYTLSILFQLKRVYCIMNYVILFNGHAMLCGPGRFGPLFHFGVLF